MKKFGFFIFLPAAFITMLLLFVLNGCSNNVDPQSGNFSMSFKRSGQIAKTASDTLTITTAKILIKDLKLKGSFIDTTNMEGDNDEDEVEFKAGPFVVSLDLLAITNTVIVNTVPPGTYYGAKFEIHKPNSGEVPPDSDFAGGPNGNERYSIVVKGLYNGLPFTYKSRMTAEQVAVFQSPVTVAKNGFINVTLTVDPSTWFSFEGHYLDPTNPDNSIIIDNLIRASFRNCYEDDNGGGGEGHGVGLILEHGH